MWCVSVAAVLTPLSVGAGNRVNGRLFPTCICTPTVIRNFQLFPFPLSLSESSSLSAYNPLAHESISPLLTMPSPGEFTGQYGTPAMTKGHAHIDGSAW